MNNQRRKKLKNIMVVIESISSRLSDCIDDLNLVLYDEEEAFDNMPENLKYSERGERSQEAISVLEDSIENLEGVISNLDDIVL